MRRMLLTAAVAVTALAGSAGPASAADGITITSGPGIGALEHVNTANGTWTWDAGDVTGPFECAFVHGPQFAYSANWQPCSSPATLPLPSSRHFMVRSTVDTSQFGSVQFLVDRVAPRAILGWIPTPFTPKVHEFNTPTPAIPLSHDSGMSMWPDGRMRNTITFRCSVDSGPWKTCAPAGGMLKLGPFDDGLHRVDVKARDLAGNEQAAPTSMSFEIDALPNTPFPIVKLPKRTTLRTIRFQVLFEQSVDGLAVCELDGRRLPPPCNDELTVAPGDHVYRVWGETHDGIKGGAFEWRWTVVDAAYVSRFRHSAAAKPRALRAALDRCAKAERRAACRANLADDRYGALRFRLDRRARVAIKLKRNGKRTVFRSTVDGDKGMNEVALSRRLSPGRYVVIATAGKAEPVTEEVVVR